MFLPRLPLLSLAPAVFLSTLVPSEAATTAIIDSLGAGALAGSEDSLDGSGKAVAFTMGPDAYTLDDLTVRLRRNTTTATGTPTMTVALYSSTESAGNLRPDTALLTFSTPTVPTGSTSSVLFTLTPSVSNYTLDANTTYWLVIYITDTGSEIIWKHGNADTTSGGVTLPDVSTTAGLQTARSFNSGAGNTLTDPSTWSTVTGNFNDLRLNATLVPEPSSALLLLPALGLLGRRRRS